ncbi:MAG TPA: EamA family transporter [Gaiellaceae bacterium]|nr:EamA family transporter [Gaiellaceae bacterium]
MESRTVEAARVPAPALVLAGIVSVQLGAAVAKSLFDDLTPTGVVALRLLFGSLVLGLLFRPRIRNRPAAELRLAVVFGLVLVSMNLCFFQALDRIPLGIAVTLEFVGPLAVALAGSRRRADVVWVALAASGIALLAPGIGGGLDGVGVAFALAAGGLWGAYILLGVRVGKAFAGPTGLVVAMAVGACIAVPLGAASAGASLLVPGLLAAGFGVALLSSAIPWSLELEALRRLPTHVFGVLMSLEPAVGALVGFVVLGEHLGLRPVVAIGLVVVASAGAARGARAGSAPRDV